jgi:hypothetical protein
MMLLNISEFFTFGSILITVLHQAVYLKYISVGLSIVSLTMIFLITINRDVSRIKKRFISAAHNFEKENKNIFFLKIIGFLIIMYYTLISATLYLLPSGPTLMLFYKLGIISVLIFGLIYTLPILYKFIKFSGNDKAALDDIFAIYSGYLGLNALLSYWIIWSFGIIIINPKKILLYNTTLDMYVVIIIISIIVVLLMSPYIISMRNLSVAQNDSNNITSRIWAGFVTLFSLFLGPALSELIIKLGMPISSVDFPALITKGLLMN